MGCEILDKLRREFDTKYFKLTIERKDPYTISRGDRFDVGWKGEGMESLSLKQARSAQKDLDGIMRQYNEYLP